MPQQATLAPEGSIPAYCTDAWSKEQVLIEPYTHLFSPAREKTALRWTHTGLRAEARFGHGLRRPPHMRHG
jgi:hypothetical protein